MASQDFRVKALGYNDLHPFTEVKLSDRESVQDLLKTILDPLQQHFSPQCSRIKVPGATAVRFDNTASEIEGYARPLWGLASMLAGGGTYENTPRWIEGLKAGTNPESEEYWGQSEDSDQRMVEMCCIGWTLAVVPAFWDALDDKEKGNVERYLGGINDKVMPNTNWLWFRVFANLGLLRNGAKHSPEMLVQDIKHLDSFYRGDGWSNDGPEHIHQMDYYSGSFAIQFLQLLYAKLAGERDPERSAEFKRRGEIFALDFALYFDEEGRALPFGRSIGYRFSMISFWGAIAYAEIDLPAPLTWGSVKGIVLRNLRWWQTQPDIFGPSGTLNLGYSYPNMYMLENYNSPGSPYWACLAFICLAVPESHPFWTSAEEPYPSKQLPVVKSLKHPKHIVTYHGGHRMLLSSGQACGYPMKSTHAKYGKFAYSSAYGYSVPPGGYTLEQFALDSTLGLSDDEGEVWKTRRNCEESGIEVHDDLPVLVSVWKPFKDVSIKTWLIPSTEKHPNWHIRVHRIETGRDVMTADGSFAIYNVAKADGRALRPYKAELNEGTSPRIVGNYDLDAAGGSNSGAEGAFAVSKGAVGIADFEPFSNRTAMIVNADPNSNIVEKKTVIPTLQHTIKAGSVQWYATGVYAKPSNPGVSPESYLAGWDSKPVVPDWIRALINRQS
ncbi:hypothetical protein V491_07209 [Pseudogymnoascus sp. VKM F-3775]|nr:hypothetical protein V491_07209 [Pseudogymnoascus sp. VKM F-3775]